MFKKLLTVYLLILIFSFSGCEDFYNFEANKLNNKAEQLVKESKQINITDEKIILLSEALKKVEKIQKKYPRTKIARSHRKIKKINKLNENINNLKKISIKEKKEKNRNINIVDIKEKINLANTALKKKEKINAIKNIILAAELSLNQIGDTRTKARLSNQIAELRININEKENAYESLLKSEEYIDQMFTDLPKKIKHLGKIYELLDKLNKKDKKENIQNKIYNIIDKEITNNDNKAAALIEIAKSNLSINNINEVKKDLEKSKKLAQKSSTYLSIAKIYYKINNSKDCKVFLEKAKIAAKSTNQEFWVIRELINIGLYEYSIDLKEQANETIIEAKKNIPSDSDERLVLELVEAFAKIKNIEEAESLISLIKTKYEQAMAFAFIGEQLAITNKFKIMSDYLDKAQQVAPDLIVGNYEFSGLPGFSTKGRIFAEIAKSYAIANNFDKSHELLGQIESDRFYKEGVSEVLLIQAYKDSIGTKKLASEMLKYGGKIMDNKFFGKIAFAQAISGDIYNALDTSKKMSLGFDFCQTLINIATHISLQPKDPLI